MTLKNSSDNNYKKIENILADYFQTNESILISPLKGGANNQVFLIKKNDLQFVVKHYFQNLDDSHSRLETEYQFLNYAWSLGIRNIPKPIAKLPENQMAIFSYLPGRTPETTKLNVEEALNFLIKLNHKKKSCSLKIAKESCFCLQDYLDTVNQKFSTLMEATKNEEKIQLLDFLKNSFYPKWEKVKDIFLKKRSKELTQTIPNSEIIITPSDFGFHNTLINQNTVYFIDFEYAGLDDIAKTICDFFCQPKYPIPIKYITNFTASLLQFIQNPVNCVRRIRDLMPICQMKWCCIILNIFLKDGKKRRVFSNATEKESIQLDKAKKLLNSIDEEFLWPI